MIRQQANTLQAAIAALQNPTPEEVMLSVMAAMNATDALALTATVLNAPYVRYLDGQAADNVADALHLIEHAQHIEKHCADDPRDARRVCVVADSPMMRGAGL